MYVDIKVIYILFHGYQRLQFQYTCTPTTNYTTLFHIILLKDSNQ